MAGRVHVLRSGGEHSRARQPARIRVLRRSQPDPYVHGRAGQGRARPSRAAILRQLRARELQQGAQAPCPCWAWSACRDWTQAVTHPSPWSNRASAIQFCGGWASFSIWLVLALFDWLLSDCVVGVLFCVLISCYLCVFCFWNINRSLVQAGDWTSNLFYLL